MYYSLLKRKQVQNHLCATNNLHSESKYYIVKMLPIAIPGSPTTGSNREGAQHGMPVDLETFKIQKIMEFRAALDYEIARKKQQAQKHIEEAERQKWQTLQEFQQALQSEIEQLYSSQQYQSTQQYDSRGVPALPASSVAPIPIHNKQYQTWSNVDSRIFSHKSSQSDVAGHTQSFESQRPSLASNDSAHGVTSHYSAPSIPCPSAYFNARNTALNKYSLKSSSEWAALPLGPESSKTGLEDQARMHEAEQLEKEYARLTGKKDTRANALENVRKMQEERRKKLEALTQRVVANRRKFAHEVKVADRPLEISFKDKSKKSHSSERREDIYSSDSDTPFSHVERKYHRKKPFESEEDTTRGGGDTSRDDTLTADICDDSTRDFLDVLEGRSRKTREDGYDKDIVSTIPDSMQNQQSRIYSRDHLLTEVAKKKVTLPSRDRKEAKLNRKKSSQKLTESRPWNQHEQDRDFHPISRNFSSSQDRSTNKKGTGMGRNHKNWKSSRRSRAEKRVERRKEVCRSRSSSKGRIANSPDEEEHESKGPSSSKVSDKLEEDYPSSGNNYNLSVKDSMELRNHKNQLTARGRTRTVAPSIVSELSNGAYEAAPSETGSCIDYSNDDDEMQPKSGVCSKKPSIPQDDSRDEEDEAIAMAVVKAMNNVSLTTNPTAEGFEVGVLEPSQSVLSGPKKQQNMSQPAPNLEAKNSAQSLRSMETALTTDEKKCAYILPEIFELTTEHGWDLKKVAKHFSRFLPKSSVDEDEHSRPNSPAEHKRNSSQMILPLHTHERADTVSPKMSPSEDIKLPDISSCARTLRLAEVRDPAHASDPANNFCTSGTSEKAETSIAEAWKLAGTNKSDHNNVLIETSTAQHGIQPPLSPALSRGGWRKRVENGLGFSAAPTSPTTLAGTVWDAPFQSDCPTSPRSPEGWRERIRQQNHAEGSMINPSQAEDTKVHAGIDMSNVRQSLKTFQRKARQVSHY